MWTRFMDMHSGGGQKEPYGRIFIEATEEEAKVVFYNRFGHSPDRVSCTCCGSDYGVSSDESLEQLSAYDRGCRHAYFAPDGREVPERKAWQSGKGLVNGCVGRYVDEPRADAEMFSFQSYCAFDEYLAKPDVLVIRASEIKDSERVGEVPEQGYVWAGG